MSHHPDLLVHCRGWYLVDLSQSMDHNLGEDNSHGVDHNVRHSLKRLTPGTHDNGGTYIICLVGFENLCYPKIKPPASDPPENLAQILPHIIPEALVYESPSFRAREIRSQTSQRTQQNNDSSRGIKIESEPQKQRHKGTNPDIKGGDPKKREPQSGVHPSQQENNDGPMHIHVDSIQIEATKLLEGLRAQFCGPGHPWKRIVLAGYGIGGIIIKKVFFATPHQSPDVETCQNVLFSIFQTCKFQIDGPVSDILSNLSATTIRIHSAFDDLLQKYMLTNVIEGKGLTEGESPPCLVGELGSFGDETEFHRVKRRNEQNFVTLPWFSKRSLSDIRLLRAIFVPQDPSIVEGDSPNDLRTSYLRDEETYILYLEFLRILSPSHRIIRETEPFLPPNIDLSSIYAEHFTVLETYDWNLNGEIQVIGPPDYGKSHLLKHICQKVKKRTTRVTIQYIHEPSRNVDTSSYGMLVTFLHQLISQRPDLFVRIERMVKEYFRWGTWTEYNLWALLDVLLTKSNHKIQFAIALDFEQYGEKEDMVQAWLKSLDIFFQKHSTNSLYILSSHSIIEGLSSRSSRVVLDVSFEFAPEPRDRFVELSIELAIKNSPRLKFLRDGRYPDIRLALAKKIHSLATGVSFAPTDFYMQFLTLQEPRISTPDTIIDQINTGPSSLADLYKYQIQIIIEAPKFVADWCGLAISWVLHGFRPLKLRELAVAVAVDITKDPSESLDGRVSQDPESDLNQYLSVFLKIEDKRVYPACSRHQLKKILEEADPDHDLERIGHTNLTKLCIHYLKAAFLQPNTGQEWEHCFNHLSSPWEHPIPAIYSVQNMDFLDYAVRNWLEHYRQADLLESADDIHAEAIVFLSNPLLRKRWLQIYLHGEQKHKARFRTSSPPFEVEAATNSKDLQNMSLVDIAEYFGLTSLVGILRKPADTTTSSIYNIRIQHGHRTRTQSFRNTSTEDFIRAVICNGEISQIQRFIETEQRTEANLLALAIYLAVQSGQLNVLQLLARAECCSKIICESKNFVLLSEWDLLRGAIMSGRREMVEYILKYKSVLNYVISLTPADWELEPLLALELDTFPVLWPIKDVLRPNTLPYQNTTPGPAHNFSLQNFYFIEKLSGKDSIRDNEVGPALPRRTALHVATQSESFEAVQFVLKSGLQGDKALEFINQKNYAGWTALHIAAALGRLDVVEELLKFGANAKINIQLSREETLAEIAAKHGHLHVLKHLLPKPKGEDRISLLCAAAKAGQLLIVEYLLNSHRTQSNSSDKIQYETALIQAAKGGYPEIVRVLLSAGVDPNCKVAEKRTALHYAAQKGHPEVAKILIDYDAKVNSSDSMRNSPLHIAAIHGAVQVAKLLIESKANVNAQNRSGSSPLHLSTNHAGMVTLLLNNGAKSNLNDLGQKSPLIIACMAETRVSSTDRLRVVKMLLDAGSETTASDSMGGTALYYAIQNGQFDIVGLICRRGRHLSEGSRETLFQVFSWAVEFSNVSAFKYFVEQALERRIDITSLRDSYRKSILHIAIRSPEILSLLLDRKPKIEWSQAINATDNRNRTALYDAVYYGRLESVKKLLAAGADISLAANNSWTPLHASYHSPEISRVLISNNADINAVTNDRRTPLMMACQFGHSQTVELLLKHHASLEQQDSEGRTALHLSALGGDSRIIKLLLGYWEALPNNDQTTHPVADMGKTDREGRTPLHIAIENAGPDVVELLIQKGSNIGVKTQSDETYIDLAMLRPRETGREILRHLLSANKKISPSPWTLEDLKLLLERNFSRGLDERIFPILEAEPALLENGVLDPLILGLRHGGAKFEETQEELAIELLERKFNPFKTRAGSKFSVFQSSYITGYQVRQNFIDACQARLPSNISDCGNGFRELRIAIEYRDNNLWQQFSSLFDSVSQIRDDDDWSLSHFIYQSQTVDCQPFVKHRGIPETATLTPKSLIQPDIWGRWDRNKDFSRRFDIGNEGLDVTFADAAFYDEKGRHTYLTSTLRSDHPFPPKATQRCYFEVEIQSVGTKASSKEPSAICIGLCGELSFLGNAAPGWNLWTLGYHGDNGGIYENESYTSRPNISGFGIGNIVGCGIDYETNHYYFTLDGKIEGKQFTVLMKKN
ncbi:hypothetical protein TWF730_008571 [Orbilia blumenaviensis]|uniref:B30.2/SPRY domain-containing protein n=1 Tax=Orbilia blumenaviensis TaxID=1796055 RepID=A0AAV9V4D3_9PEZI